MKPLNRGEKFRFVNRRKGIPDSAGEMTVMRYMGRCGNWRRYRVRTPSGRVTVVDKLEK